MKLKTAFLVAVMGGLGSNAPEKQANWNLEVSRTASGHMIGNPNADVNLSAFVSYTSAQCATFTRESEAAFKLLYIPGSRLTLDVQHIIRGPVDLTAAMLTQCGAPSRFPLNHTAFMYKQPSWLAKAQRATQQQKARWRNPDQAAARRAIARDMGFYDIMKSLRYSRIETDNCLRDEAAAMRLFEASRVAIFASDIQDTPSFAINGASLEGVHDWPQLEAALNTIFEARKADAAAN